MKCKQIYLIIKDESNNVCAEVCNAHSLMLIRAYT